MLSETKRQVIHLWNCCIGLVNLFELYNDARACERQISPIFLPMCTVTTVVGVVMLLRRSFSYAIKNTDHKKF